VVDDPKLQKAMENFQRGLTVTRMGASYVIEIAYSADQPKKAAQRANAAAEGYIEDQLTARAYAARQGSRWLEERIEELRLQMNMSALRLQEFKARRDYRLAGKAEAAAAPPAAKQEQPADKGPQNTLEELESTAATYRKIYESYLQAHTESVQRQSFPIGSARIITRATVPLSPSHPKRVRWLLLSILIGAMVGLGTAFFREGLGRSQALGLNSLRTRERTAYEY
jgi:polysaccharide biosynthesis transport protein